jgi:hypothetical protein
VPIDIDPDSGIDRDAEYDEVLTSLYLATL